MNKRQLTTKVKPSGQTQFGPPHNHWWSTLASQNIQQRRCVHEAKSVDLEQHNW